MLVHVSCWIYHRAKASSTTHLIVRASRETADPAGLYNETELDAGNIQDKQAKLDFLNKMISCVSFALGEKLDVHSSWATWLSWPHSIWL